VNPDVVSLRARIRNKAQELGVNPQILMQNYMIERFLERLSLSEYLDKLIIKGGFLVTTLVGLDARTTRDLDAVITNLSFDEQEIVSMFERIAAINLDDNVTIHYQGIKPIREEDEYGGYRVSAEARYFTIKQPMKFDFSTGEVITPREIQTKLLPLLGREPFTVMTYPVETVLAEKLHSIFSRGTDNTRLRDYYDVYLLSKTTTVPIDYELLGIAVRNTFQNRGTRTLTEEYQVGLISLLSDVHLDLLWRNYSENNSFVGALTFGEVIKVIDDLLSEVHFERAKNGNSDS
jgi:predicted nucleotidyltransferase component of viral defense system